MNIDRLFTDENFLENEINFLIKKKQIRKIEPNNELVIAHIQKAEHNLRFFKLSNQYENYNDWLIVTLYYSLYHAALVLISHKNYFSKNHYATILLLIREYSLSQEEIKLMNNLSLNKEDAELYTKLKKDRHNASYTTEIKFTKDLINTYQKKVIDFINKTKEILEQ